MITMELRRFICTNFATDVLKMRPYYGYRRVMERNRLRLTKWLCLIHILLIHKQKQIYHWMASNPQTPVTQRTCFRPNQIN